MAVNPVPDTYHTVTPYLVVKGAPQLADFITRAFGAKEVHLMKGPNGEVWHYGDRHGAMKDPCGNTWWIATHVEEVPPAELERRAAEARP
jgi:uncharacterized glyoxalase superfamily protein PhnB